MKLCERQAMQTAEHESKAAMLPPPPALLFQGYVRCSEETYQQFQETAAASQVHSTPMKKCCTPVKAAPETSRGTADSYPLSLQPTSITHPHSHRQYSPCLKSPLMPQHITQGWQ